jgi:hypothetical protein
VLFGWPGGVSRAPEDRACGLHQLPPQRQVVNDPGVTARHGAGRRAVQQVDQVLVAAELVVGRIVGEVVRHHAGVASQPGVDDLAQHREQAPVEGLVKAGGAEVLGQLPHRGAVEHDGAQQGLLCLKVMGQGPSVALL